jgi:hypothetical protein
MAFPPLMGIAVGAVPPERAGTAPGMTVDARWRRLGGEQQPGRAAVDPHDLGLPVISSP